MREAVLALLLSLGAACTTKAGGHQAGKALPGAASASSSASGSHGAPVLAKSAPVLEPIEAFRQAMRQLDWNAAATRFARLSPEQQALPELRYARAYCAGELGDYSSVLDATEGLAEALPLFGAEIARMRALAKLDSGEHEKAAAYFTKQKEPRDLLRAARALSAAKQHAKARRVVDRALAMASRAKKPDQNLLADIRAERVRVAEHQQKPALVALDLRWLALSAPTAPAAHGADRKLDELKGQRLTKQQRYRRMLAFADDGNVDAVRAELALLEKAPGPGVKAGDLLHARATAHYNKRDYQNAAELFDQAVAAGTKHRLKDKFYAARALSRSDQDLQAIQRYQQFVRDHPASGYAEDARYLVGRLHYVLGNWDEAAAAYNQYLVKYSNRGRYQKTARYELAITRLAQKEFKKALYGFERLVKHETSTRLKTRYRLLEAIALAGTHDEKDKQAAIKSFQSLIAERPLSFAALAATERLEQLGQDPPPHMAPAKHADEPPALEVELPPKAAMLKQVGLDHLAEEELVSHEPTLKAKFRPREYESLCKAYSELSGAARQYRVGQSAARWSLLTKPPTNKTRWLWNCIYPKPYTVSVKRAESEFELPSHLIYSVMRQESTFRPSVVSPAKAVGLMQMIEPTARQVMAALEIDYDASLLEVPRHNIRFGAYYLRLLLDMFQDNAVLAIASYNAGPKAVSRWLQSGEQLDLDVFVARIPYRETRGYVELVVENLARYAYLAGGVSAVPELDLKIQSGLRAPQGAY